MIQNTPTPTASLWRNIQLAHYLIRLTPTLKHMYNPIQIQRQKMYSKEWFCTFNCLVQIELKYSKRVHIRIGAIIYFWLTTEPRHAVAWILVVSNSLTNSGPYLSTLQHGTKDWSRRKLHKGLMGQRAMSWEERTIKSVKPTKTDFLGQWRDIKRRLHFSQL